MNQVPSDVFLLLLVRANELRRQGDYSAAICVYREAEDRFGETAELAAVIASCYHLLALHDARLDSAAQPSVCFRGMQGSAASQWADIGLEQGGG
jgi:hypothetical protein